MLKRLEMIGFKSFADKTAFDFPPGVTGIVGPNGSGKSNVVDAVRWVLGEQSAKSLRGGEMTDVIFNGSTSRRSLGMAEVTMTFDNSRHSLATDAEEVQIGRRVYRSGESEYLINQQACRLKDIKNLFLGSGAGTDAYCIIEQGRVDVLLQASTKDRRIIFEEAAGISRFKAKKVETLRRLERVDQNVQRLRDIMDEVEKQLRSVKLQAAKAQRYQEYTARLKELRVTLSLDEYGQLAERLQTESAQLDTLRSGLAEQLQQAETSDTALRRLEAEVSELDEQVRTQESALAAARQQIAATETTLQHEWTLSGDLEADLSRMQARLAELNARVAALAESACQAGEEMQGVEQQCDDQRSGLRTLEEELQTAVQRLAELQVQGDRDKEAHLEQMRLTARLQNDAVSYKAQVDNLKREYDRLRLRSEQAAVHLASIDEELKQLQEAEAALQAQLNTLRQTQSNQRQERDRLRQLSEQTTALISDLRAQRSGLASRIEVLEGWERSHEGLGTGVREVFAHLEQPDAGPWRTVVGMVADLLTVRREYAPLIDLALGDVAQHFLVRDALALDTALKSREQPLSGRASFLPLRQRVQPRGEDAAALALASTVAAVAVLPPQSGIVALAEQLVACERPELSGLPAQLLKQTAVVRDLAGARGLAAQMPGWRFVTLQGELLAADGTLTAGTHHAEMGLLSRKSELRELREQAVELDRRIADTEADLVSLRDGITRIDAQIDSVQEEIDLQAEKAADMRSRISQHRQRREGLHEEVELSRTEISGIEQEVEQLEASWSRAKAEAEAAERQVVQIHERMRAAELEARLCEEQRQERQRQCTTAKVGLAQVEERLAAVRARHRQIEADFQQRRQEQAQAEQSRTGARTRLAESQASLLQAESSLAYAYVAKEAAEQQLGALSVEREQKRQERQQLHEQVQASRATWQGRQDELRARELSVNDLRHRHGSLVDRLREDYQLDLAELHRQKLAAPVETPSETPVPLDPVQANEEIAELRRKLSRLGSVNLDSLQELAELETRSGALQVQFEDLTSAKRSLEEIIAKINEDSRRLFTDTFGAIRTHFQELFRKLFGGGMADIVLEDEMDILESGIEIVARPPGKELRSISLMSGGEKTMTAVALLLAIFRSKPSPFCILDEVDAALDEANVGRFTSVLRDFLDLSQFIIVTHSKRTMAATDVLYGVTMQESGISKRVAIRFEDWPDENESAASGAA